MTFPLRAFAICLGFVTVISLSACKNLGSDDSGRSPSPSSSQTSPNVDSNEMSNSNFKIPDDFPADIPLLEGELVLSSAAGESPARTWAIEVLIQDLVQARATTLQQLQDAGFELKQESGIGTDTYEATLTRFDYVVRLKVYLEPDTGELEVRYVVTPSSN